MPLVECRGVYFCWAGEILCRACGNEDIKNKDKKSCAIMCLAKL